MTARVFISYRSSDGADKATALARDLDARFGNDQVFLDKEDLPAGSRWRDAIGSALHASRCCAASRSPCTSDSGPTSPLDDCDSMSTCSAALHQYSPYRR